MNLDTQKIDTVKYYFGPKVDFPLKELNMYSELAEKCISHDYKRSMVEVKPIKKGDEIILSNPDEHREIIISICAGSGFHDTVARYNKSPWGWFTLHDTNIQWQTKGKVIDNGQLYSLEIVEIEIRNRVAFEGYKIISHKRKAKF